MASDQMTIHDCCEALRANGISCSEPSMRRFILEGKVPFGVGTLSEKGNFSGVIFRAAFYRWLDDMMGREAIRTYANAEAAQE